MSVQIFIDYKTIDSPEWITVEFSPEEYFDYDYIEPDEKVTWDCIPEYNYAIDYLDIELDRISKTHLRIIDRDAQVTREIIAVFIKVDPTDETGVCTGTLPRKFFTFSRLIICGVNVFENRYKTTFWNQGKNTFAECTNKGAGVDKYL